MSDRKALFERAVVGPAELAAEGMPLKVIMAIVVLIVISTVLDSCSLELDDYLARGSGGAFGGYSSGGSHK